MFKKVIKAVFKEAVIHVKGELQSLSNDAKESNKYLKEAKKMDDQQLRDRFNTTSSRAEKIALSKVMIERKEKKTDDVING